MHNYIKIKRDAFAIAIRADNLVLFGWHKSTQKNIHQVYQFDSYQVNDLILFNYSEIVKWVTDFIHEHSLFYARSVIAIDDVLLINNCQDPVTHLTCFYRDTQDNEQVATIAYSTRFNYHLLAIMCGVNLVGLTTLKNAYYTLKDFPHEQPSLTNWPSEFLYADGLYLLAQ